MMRTILQFIQFETSIVINCYIGRYQKDGFSLKIHNLTFIQMQQMHVVYYYNSSFHTMYYGC